MRACTFWISFSRAFLWFLSESTVGSPDFGCGCSAVELRGKADKIELRSMGQLLVNPLVSIFHDLPYISYMKWPFFMGSSPHFQIPTG